MDIDSRIVEPTLNTSQDAKRPDRRLSDDWQISDLRSTLSKLPSTGDVHRPFCQVDIARVY